ncbi:hypothetical protein J1614_005801 [Plenodomus biglobosus]|nr:hypothetical protein J1614_005801 [Plenodomus biglobosus]
MAVTADGKKSIIITAVLSVIATLFVVARVWMRAKKGFVGSDDWLLIAGVFLLYLQDVGAILLAVKGGEGKPFAELTMDEMTWLFKMFFWPELGYTITITLIKVSILISFKRIFGHIPWVMKCIYIIGGLCVGWGIGIFLTVVFQCNPVDKVWLPLKPGHCIELIPFLWGNSISNNLLDWSILLLPIIPVWGLQMESRQKALVLCAFFLGSLACIASLVRAVMTVTIDLADISKSVFNASVWTYIEPCLGISSACLPFLANSLGQRLLNIAQVITSIGSKVGNLLSFHSSRSQTNESDTHISRHHDVILDGDELVNLEGQSVNSKRDVAHSVREVV